VPIAQNLFEPDTMMKSSVPPNAPVALPPLVAAYVEATNSFEDEVIGRTIARLVPDGACLQMGVGALSNR
jgi:acyl-CoA hydrolase